MPAVRQDVKVEMADKKRAENRLDAKLLKPQSEAPGGSSSRVEECVRFVSVVCQSRRLSSTLEELPPGASD
jgi:hypothetical protein